MSYIMIALGWVLKTCSDIIGNYGVAIILFTILMKLILMPLTVKQQKSMLNTQKLQPLLAELQRKYANDKEKLNQETMKLYQKYKINPMSGCLPLLIQLPILMALYCVVKQPIIYIMGFGEDEVWRIVSAVTEMNLTESFCSTLGIDSLEDITANAYANFGLYEIQIARFLQMNPAVLDNHWISELGKNFNLINFDFLTIDLSRTPDMGKFFRLFLGRIDGLTMEEVKLWSIPLLSGLSAYATSKLSQVQQQKKSPSAATTATGEEAPNPAKSMMLIMPLMSAWFAFTLPTAVGLYWIVSNILALIQQVLLNKFMKPEITNEQIEGEILNANKNRKKRKK